MLLQHRKTLYQRHQKLSVIYHTVLLFFQHDKHKRECRIALQFFLIVRGKLLRHVGEDRNTDDTDLMDMHGFFIAQINKFRLLLTILNTPL
jgi:hypothetical protein